LKIFVTLATGKVAKHKGPRLALRLPKDGLKGTLRVCRFVGASLVVLKEYKPGEWMRARVEKERPRKKTPRAIQHSPTPPPGLKVGHLIH
jgi:hypothetical protein